MVESGKNRSIYFIILVVWNEISSIMSNTSCKLLFMMQPVPQGDDRFDIPDLIVYFFEGAGSQILMGLLAAKLCQETSLLGDYLIYKVFYPMGSYFDNNGVCLLRK